MAGPRCYSNQARRGDAPVSRVATDPLTPSGDWQAPDRLLPWRCAYGVACAALTPLASGAGFSYARHRTGAARSRRRRAHGRLDARRRRRPRSRRRPLVRPCPRRGERRRRSRLSRAPGRRHVAHRARDRPGRHGPARGRRHSPGRHLLSDAAHRGRSHPRRGRLPHRPALRRPGHHARAGHRLLQRRAPRAPRRPLLWDAVRSEPHAARRVPGGGDAARVGGALDHAGAGPGGGAGARAGVARRAGGGRTHARRVRSPGLRHRDPGQGRARCRHKRGGGRPAGHVRGGGARPPAVGGVARDAALRWGSATAGGTPRARGAAHRPAPPRHRPGARLRRGGALAAGRRRALAPCPCPMGCPKSISMGTPVGISTGAPHACASSPATPT